MAHVYPDHARGEVVPLVPRGARTVLEVGCSYGSFSAELKRQRPSVETWGIEPAEDAAEVAAARIDHVAVGYFPEALPRGTFDCVVFNDVLEHLADPWETLATTKAILNPGGTVVASLPNVRHWDVLAPLLFGARWTYTQTGILDRTHLRFFTRGSAVDLFESSGYHVVTVVRLRDHVRSRAGRVLTHSIAHWPHDLRTMQFGIVAQASSTSQK